MSSTADSAPASASPLFPEVELMNRALKKREASLEQLQVFLSASGWEDLTESQKARRVPELTEAMRQARRMGHTPLLTNLTRLAMAPAAPSANVVWSFFARVAIFGAEAFHEALRLWPQEAVAAFSSQEKRAFPAGLSLDGALLLARATQACARERFGWTAWAHEMASSIDSWALAEPFLREGPVLAPDLRKITDRDLASARRSALSSLLPLLGLDAHPALLAQSGPAQERMGQSARRLLADSAVPFKDIDWRARIAVRQGLGSAMGLVLPDGRGHPLAMAFAQKAPLDWLEGKSFSDAMGLPILKNNAPEALRRLRGWQEAVTRNQGAGNGLSVAAAALLWGNAPAFAVAAARTGEPLLSAPFYYATGRKTINPRWVLWSNPREAARNPGFGPQRQKERVLNAIAAIRRHCLDAARAEELIAQFDEPAPEERPERLVDATGVDPLAAIDLLRADAACVAAMRANGSRNRLSDPVSLCRQMEALGQDLSLSATRCQTLFNQMPPAWLVAAQDAAVLRGAVGAAQPVAEAGDPQAAKSPRGLRL